jgi:hypothetical protein
VRQNLDRIQCTSGIYIYIYSCCHKYAVMCDEYAVMCDKHAPHSHLVSQTNQTSTTAHRAHPCSHLQRKHPLPVVLERNAKAPQRTGAVSEKPYISTILPHVLPSPLRVIGPPSVRAARCDQLKGRWVGVGRIAVKSNDLKLLTPTCSKSLLPRLLSHAFQCVCCD